MAFDAIIRKGLTIADRLTSSLQAVVIYEPWVGNDGYGDQLYGPPQNIDAVVGKTNELMRDSEGREIVVKNVLTIPRPIPANGATGRSEPIDPRDKFTLQDGDTGPIASVDTVIDPSTDSGYYQIVYLGRRL